VTRPPIDGTSCPSNPTPLIRRVAADIVERIREHRMTPGTRLVERELAEHLRVSRSPVRSALRLLADDGVVAAGDAGGYVVRQAPEALVSSLPRPAPAGADEERYLRIAADRLDGVLPERVTEAALLRRYDLTPAQLTRVLRRIAGEGWIDRLPGYGWTFLPMLDSLAAYRDSYRFRLVIEPAAILEPTFELNRPAIERVRGQQQELVDGGIWTIGNPELFDLNRSFHEAVIECARNTFFSDALHRVDTVRRLIEYRRSLQRERALVRCREHVALADLLLAGNTRAAAAAMREHLATVGDEKTHDPGEAGAPDARPGADGAVPR
jgi:DNA-binding GntR family transcriptional regulator